MSRDIYETAYITNGKVKERQQENVKPATRVQTKAVVENHDGYMVNKKSKVRVEANEAKENTTR
ncbi:hypothetical protein DOS68_00020 [Staphylococcus felis]|nr:hypothetical protein DOS68_00020 [Staphylococcus felis]